MKLIALFLALGAERLATHLFHLRELRWLQGIIDTVLGWPGRLGALPPTLAAAGLLVLMIAPVLWIRLTTIDALLGLPYLAFSVVVLFLCLGPQDIGEQVDQWSEAVTSGDEELAAERGRALLDCDPRPNRSIVDAVFVQGNNRIFSVVFWFICFGPVGAWAMRMADMLRRRSILRRERIKESGDESLVAEAEPLVAATERVHAVLAFIPARLTALTYAVAGSFDRAWEAYSRPDDREPADLGEENDRLLIDVGCAALVFSPDAASDTAEEVQHAQAAKRLLLRALIVWVVVVAIITIAGPIV